MPTEFTFQWAAGDVLTVLRKQTAKAFAGQAITLAFRHHDGDSSVAGAVHRLVISRDPEFFPADPPWLDLANDRRSVTDEGAGDFEFTLQPEETDDWPSDTYHLTLRNLTTSQVISYAYLKLTGDPVANGAAPVPDGFVIGLTVPSGLSVSPASLSTSGTFVISTALSGLVKAAAGGFTAIPLVEGSRRLLTEAGDFVDESYTHTQASAAATWTITHNLGKYPSVTIVDSGGDQVLGEVEYTSVNQLVVSFSASFAGKAYLN